MAFAVMPLSVGFAGVVLGCALVALALLDALHLWLPEHLTFPLTVAGVAASMAGLGPPIFDSLVGLIAGFASLAMIGAAYRRVRGRVGLGGGDPKLFAAIGAWVGWSMLPAVLVLASLAGLAVIAVRAVGGAKVTAADKVPLGTLMAVAAWPVWLFMTSAG